MTGSTLNRYQIGGHNMAIIIQKLEDQFTLENVQELLNLAHESNEKNGLIYATAHQTTETLREKIGSGTCYIAVDTETCELVGTATICLKKLSYWYYSGQVYLLKLLGIHPSYKGKGIGTLLVQQCIDQARSEGIELIVGDSAEENIALKTLLMKFGFVTVDCVKYKSNSFVSAVYAKWINDDCPWTAAQCSKNYRSHRANIVEKD